MDYRSIITLSLRLAGVLILVHTLPQAPAMFVAFTGLGTVSAPGALLMMALAHLIPVLVALGLIYFPGRLGQAISGHVAPAEQAGFTERVGEVAFMAVGVYLLATGLLDVAYSGIRHWLYAAFAQQKGWDDSTAFDPESLADLLTSVIQVIIGLAMAIGSNGILRAVRRLRTTGAKS